MAQTPTVEPSLEALSTAPTHQSVKMKILFAVLAVIFFCIGIVLAVYAAGTPDPTGVIIQIVALITFAASYMLLLSLFVSFGASVNAKLFIIFFAVLITILPVGFLATFIIQSRQTASIELDQVPRYPDSSNWDSYLFGVSGDGKPSGNASYGIKFTVNAPVEQGTFNQVLAFYTQQLAKLGWNYIGQSTLPHDYYWHSQAEPQYVANFSKNDLQLKLLYPDDVTPVSGDVGIIRGFSIEIHSTKPLNGIAAKIVDYFTISIQ